MDSIDNSPIKLPAGTVTSKADLFRRGINPSAYASVTEMEIAIQDNMAAAFGPISLAPQLTPEESMRKFYRSKRIGYQLFSLTLVSIVFILVSLYRKDDLYGSIFLIAGALVVFAVSSPFTRMPELHYEQKIASLRQRIASIKFGFGTFFGFIGITLLIFIGATTAATTTNAYPPVDGFQSPLSALTENRNKSIEFLTEFYKPGTPVAKIFNYCSDKRCGSPSVLGLDMYHQYAINPKTYVNDVCTKLYAMTGRPLPDIKGLPTVTWSNFSKNRSQVVNCEVSTNYREAEEKHIKDKNTKTLMLIGVLFSFGMIVYLIAIKKSLMWTNVFEYKNGY